MTKILLCRNCLVIIVILKSVFARSYSDTKSALALNGKYKDYVNLAVTSDTSNYGKSVVPKDSVERTETLNGKYSDYVDRVATGEYSNNEKNSKTKSIHAILPYKEKSDLKDSSDSIERTDTLNGKYKDDVNRAVTENSNNGKHSKIKSIHTFLSNKGKSDLIDSIELSESSSKKSNVTTVNRGEENIDSPKGRKEKGSKDSKETDLKKRLEGESVAEKNDNRNEQWPLGVVPYYVDQDSYDGLMGERVRLAMNTIEDASCVQFKALVEPQNDSPWIHLTNPTRERGCVHEADSSKTLHSNGSGIVMVLGLDCMQRSDILHSLMHALGFKDEVTHPQRDQYVRIKWDNIQPQYRSLFHISYDETRTTEYDPASIMHFHDRAFTKNGQATIATLVPGLMISPSKDLSPLDKMKLRLMFGHECNRRKVGDLVDVCKAALQADEQGADASHGQNPDSGDKHDDHNEGKDKNNDQNAGDNPDDPNNENGVDGGDEGKKLSGGNDDNENQDAGNKDGIISMTDEENEKQTTKKKLRYPTHPPIHNNIKVGP